MASRPAHVGRHRILGPGTLPRAGFRQLSASIIVAMTVLVMIVRRMVEMDVRRPIVGPTLLGGHARVRVRYGRRLIDGPAEIGRAHV